MSEKGKKIYIRTFGCQMNERDSEFVTGLFLEKGYKIADSPDKANVIIFNTCSVRSHAEERAVSSMGQLMHRYKDKKIYAVAGCSAQALKGKLFERLPELNIVCGTGEIARLPELVKKIQEKRYERRETGERGRGIKENIIAVDNIDSAFPEIKSEYREDRLHAYVSVMRGCNNFCSYCIVPYVRGKERSRNVRNILDEIRALVKRGIRDITLLGQNVNSYKGIISPRISAGALNGKKSVDGKTETCDFVQLLKIVNGIDGIEKMRFMTSHPKDASIGLIKAIRDLDKAVKHLHLPLQSGSDRILRLMNRGYTVEKYLDIIGAARKIVPGLRFTTDIITGFPTETEKDFEATFRLMEKMEFDQAYIFKYSPRPGTRAGELEDDVPEEAKRRRHRELLGLQREISGKKNEKNYYTSRD